MTRAFPTCGEVRIETTAKPGVLYKFSEGVRVIFCGPDATGRSFLIKREKAILMYLETIRHIEMSKLLWYEHKFLDLNGKVVQLAQGWSNRDFAQMETVVEVEI